MKRKIRTLMIFAGAGIVLMGGLAAIALTPQEVQASPLAAFGPQVKVTVLDIPSAQKDVTGQYVKIGDVGTFVTESSSSMIEVAHQGRLFVQAIRGNDIVYFQLRVDDVPGLPATGLYHLNKREQNQETPAAFSGFWQGLPAGEHTVSLWARAGSAPGSASAAAMDQFGREDNIVIVKEYLSLGSTYLPTVQR